MQTLSIETRAPAGIVLAVVLAASGSVEAQEARTPEKPGATRSVARSPFFKARWVDFWGDRNVKTKSEAKPNPNAPEESIWAEPVPLPDGRYAVRLPRKEVLQFLENPTLATGRMYVAWQSEKMKRMKAATSILRQLRLEAAAQRSGADKTDKKESSPLAAPFPSPRREILFFKRDDCPFCHDQEQVLRTLEVVLPSFKVRRLDLEQEPELTKAYGVTAVPTLVVPRATGGTTILRGFMPAENLIQVIQEGNRGKK